MQNRMLLDYYIGCWCSPEAGAAGAGDPQHPAHRRLSDTVYGPGAPPRRRQRGGGDDHAATGGPRPPVWSTPCCGSLWSNWMDMPDLPKGTTADYLSLRYSHPKWLVLRLLDLIGAEETQEFLRLDNDAVPTTHPGEPPENHGGGAGAGAAGPTASPCSPTPGWRAAWRSPAPAIWSSLPAFREGRFLVQDAAARLAAMAAAAAPGRPGAGRVRRAREASPLRMAMDMGDQGRYPVLRRPSPQAEAHRKRRRSAWASDLHPHGCWPMPGSSTPAWEGQARRGRG